MNESKKRVPNFLSPEFKPEELIYVKHRRVRGGMVALTRCPYCGFFFLCRVPRPDRKRTLTLCAICNKTFVLVGPRTNRLLGVYADIAYALRLVKEKNQMVKEIKTWAHILSRLGSEKIEKLELPF